MPGRKKLAIIGSGPSAIFLLKHLLDAAAKLRSHLGSITIFEKSAHPGMGMPYSPETTDRANMANIPSEEIPPLLTSLAEWLKKQKDVDLEEFRIKRESIGEKEIYPRLVLGKYFQSQYREIISALEKHDFAVREVANTEVIDLLDDDDRGVSTVVTSGGEKREYDKVVIATGHSWPEEDRPAAGFYASPWPIAKLLQGDASYDFPIGTLGASLSAFDVVASLASRQGKFIGESGNIRYEPFPESENFKIVMHAGHGRLPHLRYSIEKTERKIYQHVSRKNLLALIDGEGFLRLETYYDEVCRPALSKAFFRDDLVEIAQLLLKDSFSLSDFIEKMTSEHDYADAFEGMRSEMGEAADSVKNNHPIHWKEVVDDLIYTLNFHAELLPAEDHLRLHAEVMPFIMNVIAAMPLRSAGKLLAMHDAGKLEIVSGKVTIADDHSPNATTIEVKSEDATCEIQYRMFIDCSGQKPLQLEDYLFPGLIASGTVRNARARFADETKAGELDDDKAEAVLIDHGQTFYRTGGIDIDGTYHLINKSGVASKRIQDIAFPHTSGIRPYSYGLQSCNDTGKIIIQDWLEKAKSAREKEPTEIYAKI